MKKKPRATEAAKRARARKLLTDNEMIAKSLDRLIPKGTSLSASVVSAVDQLRTSLMAHLITIQVIAIDGCAYLKDLDGWVQTEPTAAPRVYFVVTNIGPNSYSGKVSGTIDTTPLLSVGAESHISLLPPGAALCGRLWCNAPVGVGLPLKLTLNFGVYPQPGEPTINPVTGILPPTTVATSTQAYICGDRPHVNSALISALGIHPVYDSAGRLTSASAIDRNGVFRQIQCSIYQTVEVSDDPQHLAWPYGEICRVRIVSSMTYSEQPLDGKNHVYDAVQREGFTDQGVRGRMFSQSVSVDFDNTASTFMFCNVAAVGFPQGSEVAKAGDLAAATTWGFSTYVTGFEDQYEGTIKVDDFLDVYGYINGKKFTGLYSYNKYLTPDGYAAGYSPTDKDKMDPALANYFEFESGRLAYFSPLLNEDLSVSALQAKFKKWMAAPGGGVSVAAAALTKTGLIKTRNSKGLAANRKQIRARKTNAPGPRDATPPATDADTSYWPDVKSWIYIGSVALTALIVDFAKTGIKNYVNNNAASIAAKAASADAAAEAAGVAAGYLQTAARASAETAAELGTVAAEFGLADATVATGGATAVAGGATLAEILSGPVGWITLGAVFVVQGFSQHLAKKVQNLPVYVPANIEGGPKTTNPPPEGGGPAPGNVPPQPNYGMGEPPSINPNAPVGIGAAYCDPGYTLIDGVCVPLGPVPTWPPDR